MYPNSLDDPEGTGNIAFATNTHGNGSGAKVPSASLSNTFFGAVYGGLHQEPVLGRFFLKYARWWFQTCLYVQPRFREDSHFDDRIFSDGLKPQPPSSQSSGS